MKSDGAGSLAKASRVLLIILLFSSLRGLIGFFQTEYQLVSPLIPTSIVLTIGRPFLIASLVGIVGTIAALLFYFYARYLVTVILCGITLIAQQVYLYFNETM